MAKYYAEKRPVPRNPANPLKQWLWIFVAFSSGYFLSALYDVASFKQFATTQVNAILHHTPVAVVVKSLPAPLPPAKPKLEFYTLLTKDTEAEKNSSDASSSPSAPPPQAVVSTAPSVVPSVKELALQPKTKEITAVANQQMTTHEQYAVQLAAFNNQVDAERMKAVLIFKGLQVNVTTTMQNRIQWYRVVLGPFPSKGAAEAAMQAVAKRERVSGIIRKVST